MTLRTKPCAVPAMVAMMARIFTSFCFASGRRSHKVRGALCLILICLTFSQSARLHAQEPASSRETVPADATPAAKREAAGETASGEAPFAQSFTAEVGFSAESLSNGFAPWRSQYLLLIKKWEQRKVAYGQLSRVERYGRRDGEALGGFYLPLGRRTTFNLEGSVSSSHRVLPRWSAFGEVSRQIGKGRFVNAGFRHSEYQSTGVSTPQIGIEQYFGPYRAAYTLRLPKFEGERTTAHVLQGNYYYGKSNIGLSFSLGREVDLIAPGTVDVYGVRGAALSGLHYFNPDWALNYRLGTTRQGDFYTRRGLSLGVRHDF